MRRYWYKTGKRKTRTQKRHERDARYYYLGVALTWKNLKRLGLRTRIRLAFSLIFKGNAGEKQCRKLSKLRRYTLTQM